MKRALVTGVTGQDGSYLAEHLVRLGYEVHGVVRRTTRGYTPIEGVNYLVADMVDGSSLMRAVEVARPDEVYNLAADSFVGSSWNQPVEQAEITGLGCLRLLEAVRVWSEVWKRDPYGPGEPIRFYQASTSELFSGNPFTSPQNESTVFHPRSPYGVAKMYAHQIAVNYRESHGMWVCCGILFNHESPRRGTEFVTQKIVRQAVEMLRGKRDGMMLGNLEARRDWGYAPEYVQAMHLMLQQPAADDYVVATGETHTVQQFLDVVLGHLGLSKGDIGLEFECMRPAEVHELRGDATKIAGIGWRPRVLYEELAHIMCDAELKRTSHEAATDNL